MISAHYQLDTLKGSTKGLIGEILFKESKKNIFCTKLCNSKFLEKLPFIIPKQIITFLTQYWHSLDCFAFETIREQDNKLIYKKIILYEVKTQKHQPKQKPLFKKCTFTKNQIEIYKEAIKLGIETKLVKVIFFENWKYNITILDLNPEKYHYLICNGSASFQKKSSTKIF